MQLDPVADRDEILEGLAAHDYPWDTMQALSFALFRTFAVPSIGGLLDRTGEFTERVQQRYDDTALLLEEVQRHGLDSARGRQAVRRINQMHGMYDISNDDMRYVLATFVVVPARWFLAWGWRPMTPHEQQASVAYYRDLGRHMAIRDLPETYEEFERLLDDYEAVHFSFDEGARRVADSTLELMATFPPTSWLPAWAARRFAFALMDEPLLRAFGYPMPTRAERGAVRLGMRARALGLRLAPGRGRPKWASDFGRFRSRPDDYLIDRLGTFTPAPGCPVPRRRVAERSSGGAPADVSFRRDLANS